VQRKKLKKKNLLEGSISTCMQEGQKRKVVGCNKSVGAFARNHIKMRKWEEI
jgi:hypothetical protein